MADPGTPSPLRVLAPAALVVFAIAFFAVILGSGGSEEGSSERTATKEQRSERKRGGDGGERRKPRVSGDTYTVKTGDTLGGIAAKVGLSVDRLQELNPDLDPQALVSGQKIKLRE